MRGRIKDKLLPRLVKNDILELIEKNNKMRLRRSVPRRLSALDPEQRELEANIRKLKAMNKA